MHLLLFKYIYNKTCIRSCATTDQGSMDETGETDRASEAARSTSFMGQDLSKHLLNLCFQFAGAAGVANFGMAAKYLHTASENGDFWTWAVQAELPHIKTAVGAMGGKRAYELALQKHRWRERLRETHRAAKCAWDEWAAIHM